MKLGSRFIQISLTRPKLVITLIALATVLFGALTSKIHVDTDPENMLSKDEAVRVFHNTMKKDFTLHDVVVLGIVNEKDPDGVFNPATLQRVQELTEFALTLVDPDDETKRVVARNVIAPGTVDSIEQAGLGQVRFKWLMREAPTTREGALKIRDNAMGNPLLKGTMVSEDGKAICLYLPITTKDFAYQVRKQLLEKIGTLSGDEHYYITGLPVANDTFGIEMFKQMATSAPLAMLAIFILMLFFFRKPQIIIAPMIIAVVTVICTMGLLIGTGNTVHIMSSMIPIFLMPIAVVDSIHILSEFFDTYQTIGDRRRTIESVMGHLFMPMLYTSLTSTAGFVSLTLTPIPPVQVFGLFVAFGIMLAWLLTIIFIPAYIMLMKEESLASFGVITKKAAETSHGKHDSLLTRILRRLGAYTHSHAKLIIATSLVILAGAGYGITKIQVNDNPVKWFKKDHAIRIADKVLNNHFGGTYEAYLVLENATNQTDINGTALLLKEELHRMDLADENGDLAREAEAILDQESTKSASPEEFFNRLTDSWQTKMDAADDAAYDIWADMLDILDKVRNRDQIFKQPEMLRYVETLQEHLQQSGIVGKSNSITDVVKKVHQELFEANPEQYRVPDTANAVAQCLISFQNSHKPDDLWHLVTPDYTKANIWVQLKSGDNKDMESVVDSVTRFMEENPPPFSITANWAGLTYINVVWQEKMVFGMLESFLSSFAVVFVMMVILFRSFFWGLLAMVPLSVTIAAIYGIIGFAGKDYDMPVAVLSSLTLGLAVDFAIHFLERSRMTYKKTGSWEEAAKEMFEEPARAITRNVIVIAVGFTPLLAASLVPYQTVGFFLASIMALSGIATLFILPSLITVFEPLLFKNRNNR